MKLLLMRGPFLAVALLTWLVALLLYIPFTYEQFLKGGVFPSVNWFLEAQQWFYWGSFALAALASRRQWSFLATGALAGVFFAMQPLGRLQTGTTALLAGFTALLPLAALGAADCAAYLRAVAWSHERTGEDRRIFGAAWRSALFVAAVYAGIAIYRGRLAAGPETGTALLWTLASHLAAFGGLFALAQAIRGASEFFREPARAEFGLLYLCGAAGLALALYEIGFRPVSFTGVEAVAAAASASLAWGACMAGLSVRLWRPSAGAVTGAGLALASLGALRLRSRRTAWPALALLAALAFAATVHSARMDWNYLLQKSGALVVWAAAFTGFYAIAPRRSAARDRSRWMLMGALAALGGYKLLGFVSPPPADA